MRYTRYDYKKKKGDSFVWWLVLIIIVSILIGIGIYNMVFLGLNKSENKSTGNTSEEGISNGEDKAFIVIQCGLYSNEKNAQDLLKTIPEEYGAAIVQEDGKFKVIAGIFTTDEGEKKSNKLASSNVSNFRIKFHIPIKDTSVKTEGEIIQGYIMIINKVYEKDVKSINTKEFKTWTEEVADKAGNEEEIKLLVENIKNLPEEYNREYSKNSIKFLYNILLKYKVS